jgi:lysine biosynthesis protein LysW
MVTAKCPSCGKQVVIGPSARMGQRLNCKRCNTEVEVVWLDPLELDWPYDDDDKEFDDEFDEWDTEEESY